MIPYDENGFEQAVRTVLAPWLRDHVTGGTFTGFDGARIQYYKAEHPDAKAAVVMVHGFCEFFGKFHETAYDFHENGYSVYFLEQRGHGGSQRSVDEPDVVDVADFSDYVEDLKCFLDQVVLPQTSGQRLILYAHSMGGCVGALFLERYRKFLKPGGIVHLKTDSRYLYEYTRAVCKVNELQVLAYGTDIYHEGIQGDMCPQNPSGSSSPCPSHSPSDCGPLPFTEPRAAMGLGGTCLPDKDAIFEVQTFYEKMFLEMGLPITYMAFQIDHIGPYAFPGEAFDHDYWLEAEGPRRSFSHQPNKKG